MINLRIYVERSISIARKGRSSRLVLYHGGRLWLETKIGLGTFCRPMLCLHMKGFGRFIIPMRDGKVMKVRRRRACGYLLIRREMELDVVPEGDEDETAQQSGQAGLNSSFHLPHRNPLDLGTSLFRPERIRLVARVVVR
jgi:hypothetical protein